MKTETHRSTAPIIEGDMVIGRIETVYFTDGTKDGTRRGR